MAEAQVLGTQDPAPASMTPAASTPAGADLLDKIMKEGRFDTDPSSPPRGKDIVARFIDEVMQGRMARSPNTVAMINERVKQIDDLLSKQVSEIMHAPEVQRMESTWRGLRFLLGETETGPNLKIKLLHATKSELLADFGRDAFDQSVLWKKIYEHEFGTFGGEPVSTILADYEFTSSSQDVDLLEHLSTVAAGAHAPLLTGASADLIDVEDFTKLNDPASLAKKAQNVKFAKWNAFRDTEDSRYVALAMPRMLLRAPYGKDSIPVDAFSFEERLDARGDVTDEDRAQGVQKEDAKAVAARTHSRYLWGNAAWALGSRVTQAFAKYNWCATIRGVESGGLVEHLPVHLFRTDSGKVAMKCPTEVQIPDRREAELASLGFAPLVHQKDTPNAAFFSVQSANRPKHYSKDSANANARLSSQIPYMFAVSRFAHYLKVIVRDKIGGFTSKDEMQKFLQNWIATYRLDQDEGSLELKAKRPIRDAKVEVTEIAGRPGAYNAVVHLRPHFQLDELQVSMRLVAELPKATR